MARLFDTIYLHAGLPKTGSSALQDSLHALSQAGRLTRVAYPCATPSLGTGNGSALARELIFTNPAPTSTPQLEACVQDIVGDHRGDTPHLLISSEDLCYADVEKFSRLKQVLLGHAKTVKLIVAVRPLKAWSYSVYLQLVKAHALAADYDAAWLRAHTGDFLYYFRNLDRFEVDTVCFRYQDSQLLRRFLALIGEDASLADQVPDTLANRSLSRDELGVVRAINAVFGDESLCRKVSDALVAQHPDRRGARFPVEREADFQAFAADFAHRLEAFPGPVMNAVKPILFDAAESAPTAVPAAMPDVPGLAADDVDTALRALRAFFQTRADEGSLHQQLVDYASGLERSTVAFDPVHYLLMHPDVLRSGSDPRRHFEDHGREEGRASALRPRDAD